MTFQKFDEAKAACGPDQSVMGVVLADGTPVYAVVNQDAADAEVAKMAFQIRHGRAMTEVEEFVEIEARRLALL